MFGSGKQTLGGFAESDKELRIWLWLHGIMI